MTAGAAAPDAQGGWDHEFGTGSPVPMSRLVRVELRKMVDTRAGLWLIVSILAVTALVMLIAFLNTEPDERVFFGFSRAASFVEVFLVPILGILLVTQEWGQRTAMVTFALTPSRGKVITAKIVAALLLGVGAFVLTMVIAVLATLLGGASDPFFGLGVVDLAQLLLLEVVLVAMGLAFGLAFLNSPVAIVTYVVGPQVISIVSLFWGWLADVQSWVSITVATRPLFIGALSAEQWRHLAVAVGIWVVLPFAVGLVRVLRTELK